VVDIRKALASKFDRSKRFENFGATINSARIDGFRGVSLDIDFEFPVTAISGLNGAGKSTVGQILLCAYKSLPNTSSRRFYLKSFFPVSVLDPKPISDSASVNYNYQTDDYEKNQELTCSRAKKEWSGYKRQPERNVEYIGFTVYIPKVERRDLSIYSARDMKIDSKRDLAGLNNKVSQILGSNYNEVYFQQVKAQHRNGELGVAKRYGAVYSENNMGFGEGRVVYTVNLLETCPEKSLIVLEEPETSLHESAQHEFAKYLMDVSFRRGHQIVFSTHSSALMSALPASGRKLLVRSESGVEIYSGVSSAKIRTALSAGESGHAIICVEDEFAQSFVREIIRRFDKELLSSVSVVPFGDAQAVLAAKDVLQKAKFKVVAVRDADQREDKKKGNLKLPGSLPPEKEIFNHSSSIKELKEKYGIDFDSIKATNPELNHHEYAEICAKYSQTSREVLETDCIRAFLDSVGSSWYDSLCVNIKEILHS